jgi:1-pyrroline-2-carboxylate reductase [NAD(P)H]
MKILSAEQVHSSLGWPSLLEALRNAYAGSFTMPQRQVMRLADTPGNHDAFALLPAWNDEVITVKAFTYFPENPPPHPALHAQILMFDRHHGQPLALIDGISVTWWRTAGISALASQLLSRPDSKTLFLLGTGKLAPFLIRAHAAARPLERVIVWGRNPEKVAALIQQAAGELPTITFEAADSIESGCVAADVIVCATGSLDILVRGDWVKPGTHVDLLGNHHAHHRECDSELITRSEVFVDTFLNCLKEAGELLIPIEEGIFSREAICGELADLCAERVPGRSKPNAITVFKSVGAALGDLATARAVWQAITAAEADN